MSNNNKIPAYFRDHGVVRRSWLTGQTVQWTTLDRIATGKRSDFVRRQHYGKVQAVSACGQIAMVKCLPYHDNVEVDVADLTVL